MIGPLPSHLEGPLTGPYVSFAELLALRYRPPLRARYRPQVMGNQAGPRLSRQRGRGVDFSEVRQYHPGDDVRTIDWRVTARKNKPHTKVFREERERLTLLVVDQTQPMFFGSAVRLKSVAAAELAAVLAWQALQQGDRVGGLVLGNDEAPLHRPRRSARAVARLLGDVARLNQALHRDGRAPDEAQRRAVLQQVPRLARSNVRICFVSDFDPPEQLWPDLLRSLSRHNELSALRIFDPLEAELPPADSYAITDGTERWQFHTGDERLRRRYAERFADVDRRFAELCRRFRVRHGCFATDEPLHGSRLGDWL